jgi:ATP synthase F1 delta subunit
MNIAAQILARRYALAYLYSFDRDISIDVLASFKEAKRFFLEHKRTLYFLSLPTIAKDTKMHILKKLFAQFKLPESINRLMELIIVQKRTSLWCEVLQYIVDLYQQQHQLMTVLIESSPKLSNDEINRVKQFLARKTGNDIIYTYRVNPDLIAGIKAQSGTVLWECSIAKNIRILRLSLIR